LEQYTLPQYISNKEIHAQIWSTVRLLIVFASFRVSGIMTGQWGNISCIMCEEKKYDSYDFHINNDAPSIATVLQRTLPIQMRIPLTLDTSKKWDSSI
jgi:hypothetical protein